MAKQTKYISISNVQVTNVNICHNHTIMYNPYDNSNPLSIETHSKVHYLYIMKLYIRKYVGYLGILHLLLGIVVYKYSIYTYIAT